MIDYARQKYQISIIHSKRLVTVKKLSACIDYFAVDRLKITYPCKGAHSSQTETKINGGDGNLNASIEEWKCWSPRVWFKHRLFLLSIICHRYICKFKVRLV